jgi:hypothetical protein
MRYPPLSARLRAARLEHTPGLDAAHALDQLESDMQDGDLWERGIDEGRGEWIDDDPDDLDED